MVSSYEKCQPFIFMTEEEKRLHQDRIIAKIRKEKAMLYERDEIIEKEDARAGRLIEVGG